MKKFIKMTKTLITFISAIFIFGIWASFHMLITNETFLILICLTSALPIGAYILDKKNLVPISFAVMILFFMYSSYNLSGQKINFAFIYLSIGFSVIYLLQAKAIKTLKNQIIGDLLTNEINIIKFFTYITIPVILISSLLNVSIYAYFMNSEFSFFQNYKLHFLANLVGCYVISTLAVGNKFIELDTNKEKQTSIYHIFSFISLALILQLSVVYNNYIIYLLVPFLIFSMIRLSYFFSSILLLIATAFFFFITFLGDGPFIKENIVETYTNLLLFISVFSFGLNFLLMQNRQISQSNYSRKSFDEANKVVLQIKDAIEKGQFKAYFQPIVDKNQNIIKYETLVRIVKHNEILTPGYFLKVIKGTHYYPLLSQAIYSQAFDFFRYRKEYFTINVSNLDIFNIKTLDFLKNLLIEFPEKNRVVFELVESESIEKTPEVESFVKFIRNNGAKLAIDDFGAGYSNFSYLTYLNPDYLKIDGSLIKNICDDENTYKIVRGMVKLAHELNIKTIAEFIETKEIFNKALSCGIDEFQGFYLGKPIPSKEVKVS